MQKTKLSVAIALLTTTPLVVAEEDKNTFYGVTASASVALTTDYIWRGISQTKSDPAIQGQFDLSHESGAYVGVWASNVQFDDDGSTDNTNIEVDAYGGYTNEFDLGFTALTYDFGWLHYEFPSHDSSNINELYVGFGVSPFENLNIGGYYYFGIAVGDEANGGDYRYLSMDYTLPDEWGAFTILGHAAHYDRKGGNDDYWDWKVGVAKDLAGFNFEIAYTDTDINSTNATEGAKVVATISKELGSSDSNGDLPDDLEASASVAMTTDYIWRGVSQTDNDPAIQGSFDIAHASGLYAGAWASSYEFGNGASMELDLYGGFSNDVDLMGTAITYDFGWLHYEYPGASAANFDEFYVGLGGSPIDNMNVSFYYYFGLDIDNDDFGDYRDLSADYTLPEELWGITLLGHLGHYDVPGAGNEYFDWKIGAAKDFGDFNLEVAYTDTDDTPAAGGLDDSKVVGTISTSF